MSDTCVICGKVYTRMSKHLRQSKTCSEKMKEIEQQPSNMTLTSLPSDVQDEIDKVLRLDALGFNSDDLVTPYWSWAGEWFHIPSETSLTDDYKVIDTYDTSNTCVDYDRSACVLCSSTREHPSKLCSSHKWKGPSFIAPFTKPETTSLTVGSDPGNLGSSKDAPRGRATDHRVAPKSATVRRKRNKRKCRTEPSTSQLRASHDLKLVYDKWLSKSLLYQIIAYLFGAPCVKSRFP